MPTPIISIFISYCETELNLPDKLIVQKLIGSNETFYKSLPLCFIDAVFSIGAKYQSVEKAFIDRFKLNISKKYSIVNEYTTNNYIRGMNTFASFEDAAVIGSNNRRRPSSNLKDYRRNRIGIKTEISSVLRTFS